MLINNSISSLSFSPLLSHTSLVTDLSFSLSSSLGPLLHPLSPCFPFQRLSLSLSFYSLLLCCIPVPVVKGVDKEEGGKEREGELEL